MSGDRSRSRWPSASGAIGAWARTHRVAIFTAAAAVVTLWSRSWAPGFTWLPLAAMLGGTTVLVTTHAANDRAVTWIAGASFSIRCVLAVSLFAVSSSRLPVLQWLQRDYGLWEFGVDGVSSHAYALGTLDALRAGADLPVSVPEMMPFSLPIAGLYWMLGPSPLHFILLNAWLGAICGVLAHQLARRLGAGRSRSVAAAAVVGLWPSSIIWSTQVLKDPSALALILGVLVLAVALSQGSSDVIARAHRNLTGQWRWVALFLALFALTFLRTHVGAVLAVSLAVAFASAVPHALLRRSWHQAVTAGGVAVLSIAAAGAAAAVDVVALSSPFNPEAAYLRLGDSYRRDGRMVPAISAYLRAIEWNPDFLVGHRRLVTALVESGDFRAAAFAFRKYLEVESDEAEREALAKLIPTQAAPALSVAPSVAIAQAPQASRPTDGSGPAPALALISSWSKSIAAVVNRMTLDGVVASRQAQLASAGGVLVDTTMFDDWPGFLRYVPRALALAFVGPFPWDLMSTGATTGALRPVAAIEVLIIALLVPWMLLGMYRALKTLRPEAWAIVLFVAATAAGYGVLMANGGTLFRVRLQFLFPALVLASTAFPAFVDRFVNAWTRHLPASPAGGKVGGRQETAPPPALA